MNFALKKFLIILGLISVTITIFTSFLFIEGVKGLPSKLEIMIVVTIIAGTASIGGLIISRRVKQRRKPKQIFIIYNRADIDYARHLSKLMKKEGLSPWLDDEQLIPGQVLKDEIINALKESGMAIIIVSKNLESDKFNNQEIDTAINLLQSDNNNITPIIPVKIDDSSIPKQIAHIQYIDLRYEYGEEILLRKLTQVTNLASEIIPGREIITGNEINLQYGVPLEKLIEFSKKIGVTENERDAWMQKYKELENQLVNRTDDIAKQAKEFLTDGKLEDAQKLFEQALANNFNSLKEAATNAFSLARIKKLQLDYQSAKNYYQQAVQFDPENALYLNELGILLFTLGEYNAAEHLYQRSLAIQEKTLDKDSSDDIAISLNNLAELYLTQGNYGQAEPLYLRSLAILEKSLGENHPDIASSLNNLAGLYCTQGRYDTAEPLYQRSLAIREKTLGENHPDIANSLNNLALFYQTQGNFGAAEPLYLRSLAIREKALGKNHPDVATSLNNLAGLYKTQGNYAAAEPLYLRSLAIREKTLGENHPDVAQSFNNLAALYDFQARYGEAEPLYQRSLAIWEKTLGENHPSIAISLNNLAGLYDAQGKYNEAEPLYLRSLAIDEKTLGENHPDVATDLNNLALFYQAQGKYNEAKPLYLRSLAILEKSLGENHPTTKTVRGNLEALQRQLEQV